MTDTHTLSARARQVGIRSDYWPYGPNIDHDSRVALVDWAERERLTLATPRGRCLHWVTGQARRCGALQNTAHRGVIRAGLDSVLDHVTFWSRDGKPALILAQPYNYPPDGWVDALIAEWSVDIRIEVVGPWYGAGAHGVFITPRILSIPTVIDPHAVPPRRVKLTPASTITMRAR